ncbi:MAG: diguanylate cyclase [Phormidesmis sp.]
MVEVSDASAAILWHPNPNADSLAPLIAGLNRHSYQVTTVASELAVLQAILTGMPDLLIIHLQAAEEDGYRLCRSLREALQSSAIPIVFVGTRSETIELPKALRSGGNDYFQMPMDEAKCRLRLERHLPETALKSAKTDHLLRYDPAQLRQQLRSYHRALQRQETFRAALTNEIHSLQRLAYLDGLTQVANRRCFAQRMADYWQQAYVSGLPVSLLLCDVDYFKRYNDTYGHLAGDNCLKSVAKALTKSIHRQADQVARYGGKVFAVLLPATSVTGARQVALAIQSALAQMQISHVASLAKPVVSLSIGICSLVPDSAQQSYEVLMQGADEALDTAKLRGRDRTVINMNSPDGMISVVPTHCVCPDGDRPRREPADPHRSTIFASQISGQRSVQHQPAS